MSHFGDLLVLGICGMDNELISSVFSLTKSGSDFSRLSRVRSKVLVRPRNLVIFEVFGVNFWAKKSFFKNCP